MASLKDLCLEICCNSKKCPATLPEMLRDEIYSRRKIIMLQELDNTLWNVGTLMETLSWVKYWKITKTSTGYVFVIEWNNNALSIFRTKKIALKVFGTTIDRWCKAEKTTRHLLE